MKVKISAGQFYKLIVIYIVANDITRGYYHTELQGDIWIPNIIGAVVSIILFTLYMFLYKNSKFDNFNNSMNNFFGKVFSKFIYVLFIVYFITLAFFNIVDISESIRKSLLINSSYILMGILLLTTVGYFLFKGLEVIARLCDATFILLLFIFFFLVIFSLSIYDIELKKILPILYNGFTIIIKPSLERGYSIPFGELFVMVIIFQYIDKKEKYTKTGNLSILTAGIILVTVTILNILIIGTYTLEFGIQPGARLARFIDIEEYVQRLDLILVSVHLVWILIKAFVLLYVAGELIKYIFNLDEKKTKVSYIIMLIVLLVMIVFLSEEYMKVLRFRKDFFNNYIGLIMEVFIPLLLVSISFIRKNKIKIKPEDIVVYDI